MTNMETFLVALGLAVAFYALLGLYKLIADLITDGKIGKLLVLLIFLILLPPITLLFTMFYNSKKEIDAEEAETESQE